LRSSCDDNTLHCPPMHLAGGNRGKNVEICNTPWLPCSAMFSYVSGITLKQCRAASATGYRQNEEARVEVASWMRWAGNKDPSDKDT
jgi:hypothetical protein